MQVDEDMLLTVATISTLMYIPSEHNLQPHTVIPFPNHCDKTPSQHTIFIRYPINTGLTSPSNRSHSHHGSSSHGNNMSNSSSNSALFSSLGNLGSTVVGGSSNASSSGVSPSHGNSTSASGGGGSRSSSGRKSDVVMCTRNLRPAISIRLMRAEERNDHVVYVIWVMDVKSGAEWYNLHP